MIKKSKLCSSFRGWSAVVVLGCLFAPRSACARLVSSLSLAQLTEQSDLVVRGRVVGVVRTVPERASAQVQVDAVLKGQLEEGTVTIALPIPEPYNQWDTLVRNEYALFFLDRKEQQVVPTDPYNIKVPIREGRLSTPAEPTEPKDRVREELLYTASGPLSLSKEGEVVQCLRDEGCPRDSLADNMRGQAFSLSAPVPINFFAIEQLASFPPEPRALALLQQQLSSKDRGMKREAATVLLRWEQPETLQAALEAASEYFNTRPEIKSEPKTRYNFAPQHDLNLLGSIATLHQYTPQSIALLGALLKHEDVWVRRAAVQALRRAHSVNAGNLLKKLSEGSSIPFLVKALDDEDFEVRFHAVSGLARITQNLQWNPLYRPPTYTGAFTVPPEEQKFLAYWKQWWQTQGKPAFDAEKK